MDRRTPVSVSLPRIVDAFAGLNVLVVGESMLDSYLQGTTSRLCPEAPVPVVDLSAGLDQPGGAANSAHNARCLGAGVAFLSVGGDDAEGGVLLGGLRERDVDPLARPGPARAADLDEATGPRGVSAPRPVRSG
jgi:bifunctional ADP-heptose synthase (sugar kinase/adenylyltransferase)